MSPEQTGRINRVLDYRSDFYSLGMSMYELITGHKPFNTTEPLKLIHRHIAVIPDSPGAMNNSIPEMICAIIMKLISKEPEARYQNAESISLDLKRCRDELQFSEYIARFDLGRNDVTPRFRLLDRLYGREDEKGKLSELYNRIGKGGKGLLLITGAAGVGKTVLIEEFCCSIGELGGLYAAGKATPYFVFAQIVKGLTEALLMESELQIKLWKERLLCALNGNGRLLTELVPELKTILGEQPRLGELGPAESRNRFYSTLCDFLTIFMRKGNPLAIFIDDLQWMVLFTLTDCVKANKIELEMIIEISF